MGKCWNPNSKTVTVNDYLQASAAQANSSVPQVNCTICGLQLNVTDVRSRQQICSREEVDAEVDAITAQKTTTFETADSPGVIYFFFKD